MQAHIHNTFALIRIDRGENVFAEIEKVCSDQEWSAAQISAIGAVMNVEMGAYNLEQKQYVRKEFKSIHELVNLQGNLSLKDNTPFLHLHGVIADEKLHTYGGHFFEMQCGVLVEVVIKPFSDLSLEREFVEEIGLAQWKFCPLSHE